ncbi:MAG TPA: hypothetical protein VGA61_21085 [Anaerolineae bacterium]
MRASLFRVGRQHSLLLLLLLAFVHGLIYAVVIPPWQAPDETGHFEYSWLLAHQGRLPTTATLSPEFEGQLIASLYEWRFGDFTGRPLAAVMPTRLDDLPENVFVHNSRTVVAGRFSLAYLWEAFFLLPVRGQDLAFQLLVARFSSILLNLGIIAFAYQTFGLLAPGRAGVPLAMTLVVVLMPQHTFINSMAGDGPLAELGAGLVLYGWLRLFRQGARPGLIVLLALATVAAIASKATAAFLVPLDLGLAAWWYFHRGTGIWSRRRFAYLGIGLAAVAAGAWIFGRSGLGAYALDAVQSLISSPKLLLADARNMTLDQALLASQDSFWGNFGWMALPLSARWYGAILALTVLALAGWLSGGREDGEPPRWAALMMAAACLVAFGVFTWTSLLANVSGYYQFQGRYLFPVVVPFTFLLVGGWLRLAPARRRQILFGVVVFVAFLDAWSLLGYIIPYFYYR